jgi:hypothetical protein
MTSHRHSCAVLGLYPVDKELLVAKVRHPDEAVDNLLYLSV